MALRTIRTLGDRILEKPCRNVEAVTDKEIALIEDMLETMYESHGVGLAAPQVGILKRIVVIDISGAEEETEEGTVTVEMDPLILINPKIVYTEGKQTGNEGCLSVPGKVGTVTRPMTVRVEALDEDMQPQTIEGTGLLARALCHEIDHLDGKLYTDLAEGPLRSTEDEEEEE